MTLQEFEALAKETISEDPYDRVPIEMKSIIKNYSNNSINQILFDVHSHCFTYRNIPSKFPSFPIRLPDSLLNSLGNLIYGTGKVYSTIKGDKNKIWNFFSKKRLLKRFAEDKTPDDVMGYHLSRCNLAFKKTGRNIPHIIMCQLMMNMEHGIKGKVEQGFYGQLKDLSDLRDEKKNNKVVLPFFGADPRNPDLLEDFISVFSFKDKRPQLAGKKAFLNDIFPFFGIKIYPSLGYFPSDPNLMKIFKICEQKNIPITTHCGSGSTRYNKTKYITGKKLILDGFGKLKEESYKILASPFLKNKKRRMARIFNTPNNWLPVIKTFPKLKLNLAHMGGDYQWERFRNGYPHTHIHETLEIISKDNNVYSDLSYACATDRNLRAIRNVLNDENHPVQKRDQWRKKLLYGSDYYLTELKKHMTTIMLSVIEELGDDLTNQICVTNPKNFLFTS